MWKFVGFLTVVAFLIFHVVTKRENLSFKWFWNLKPATAIPRGRSQWIKLANTYSGMTISGFENCHSHSGVAIQMFQSCDPHAWVLILEFENCDSHSGLAILEIEICDPHSGISGFEIWDPHFGVSGFEGLLMQLHSMLGQAAAGRRAAARWGAAGAGASGMGGGAASDGRAPPGGEAATRFGRHQKPGGEVGGQGYEGNGNEMIFFPMKIFSTIFEFDWFFSWIFRWILMNFSNGCFRRNASAFRPPSVCTSIKHVLLWCVLRYSKSQMFKVYLGTKRYCPVCQISLITEKNMRWFSLLGRGKLSFICDCNLSALYPRFTVFVSGSLSA